MQLPQFKIGTKITLLAVIPVLIVLVASSLTLLQQKKALGEKVAASIRQQGNSEASKIAKNVFLLCAGTEARNQKELTHSLGVARELLAQAGGASLAPETTSWQAVNQLTKSVTPTALPKMTVGSHWLGQIESAQTPALIVDEASHLTGNFCTIFQRMNDDGDMLRVSTSVLKTDGTRALGTFIPAKNADGNANAIIEAILRGETFRGRAFVVNAWHATAYEPIWDAGHTRVIGMLYAGIGMTTINQELHDSIVQMVVGKTGYVFVVGGLGDERGKYVVSAKGKRDGENIWEAKDASGRAFIQSLVGKARQTKLGEVDYESYAWKNEGETKSRTKFAAVTYFPQWDWVIGASAYEDDFAEVRDNLENAQQTMLLWVVSIATAVALIASVIGIWFSISISRPIARIIADLSQGSEQITAASGQVSDASQALAEGSSEQASSLEETSASLEEMSSMTKRNADHASQANDIARQARTAADTGASDMQTMGTAMNDIKTASDDIAKIIKTIDEIAFQTNILALNAAVEAARAGEAGMGFAVVAEEVRALAQRSATAAKETAAKIESAIAKTALGVEMSQKVARSLTEIVEKVRQVDGLIVEVATASNEQNQGVQQINGAIGQMDKVVQSNAASAEESAAAAEELNAQAHSLNDAVSSLQQLMDGRTSINAGSSAQSMPSARKVAKPAEAFAH